MNEQRPAAPRFAVFGHPIAHSRSPEIHRAFAAQRGKRIDYQAIDVPPERFEAEVVAFFRNGGAGANVTVPHKGAAAALAEALEPRARRAGAVNTLLPLANGGLAGHNTDGPGLRADLERNLGWLIGGRRVALLGAGGAAAGVVESLLEAEPRCLVIANRTPARAETLIARFAGLEGPLEARAFMELQAADVVINATAASLGGDVPALPSGVIHGGTLAYDMGYGPTGTPFTAWARSEGAARVADGLGMLVEQAAEAFALWHGWRPETTPVLAALRKA